MAKATFVQGDAVTMVDYTPSGADVSAGDVVVGGDAVLVAHRDIADGDLGALAVGGGVYDIVKGAGAIGLGASVYWDAAEGEATTTATSNKKIGLAVKAALANDATVRVYHRAN